MHDHASWSLSLGRWGSVHVRLHMLFLIFAACTFYLSWRDNQAGGTSGIDWVVAQSLGVLLLSVALHELGHVFAAWRLGGSVSCIVLGPLGGLTSVKELPDYRSELMAHLAGPAVNFVLCLLCTPILLATSGNLVGLLTPLSPEGLTESNGFSFLIPVKLCFWINWTLTLVNLLPVFPFDGGQALRAAILLRWPEAGRRAASQFVSSVAKFVAVGVFVTAFLLEFEDEGSLIPMRFALILLSIFLFFSARYEERRSAASDGGNRLLDSELTSDLSGLERELARTSGHPSGPLRRWLDRRREIRSQRQLEIEATEERCVDAILARLHEHGMDSLSAEDRALLERVSARFRSRQSQ
jgi:Zn-dependent protease